MPSARCGVCRRQSFMEEHAADGALCSDCTSAFAAWMGTGANAKLVHVGPATAVMWGARRAWEFADAITDATSFAHRPGDPGHSRTPTRVRGRRK